MREIVFRVLSGFLAIAFVWLLVFGDTSRLARSMLVGMGVVTVAFGAFAAVGTRPAERVLAWALGGDKLS